MPAPPVPSIACVTGGTGFVGRHLVDRLLAAGLEVRVLSRSGSVGRAGVVAWRGDLLEQVPAGFLSGAHVLYNCAGEVRDAKVMRALHCGGTSRLLDAACEEIRASGKAMRWVQLSSVGAYGPLREYPGQEFHAREGTPERPVGDYEETKTVADALVRQRQAAEPRLAATILRPSNIFGPDMPNGSVRALLGAIERGRFFYIGRDDAVATYIHVDDVVSALLACGTHPAAIGKTYNLSNDCLLRDIVDAVADGAGVARPTLRVPEGPLRAMARLAALVRSHPLTPSRIDALTRRVRYGAGRLAELGFAPEHPVPQSMAELAARWRRPLSVPGASAAP